MPVNMQEGKSALILVSEHGHISLVLTVLDGGADVNFQHQVCKQKAESLSRALATSSMHTHREQDRLLSTLLPSVAT